MSKVATAAAGLNCVTRRTNLGHAHLLSLSPAAEKRNALGELGAGHCPHGAHTERAPRKQESKTAASDENERQRVQRGVGRAGSSRVEKRKQQAANNVWHGTEAANGRSTRRRQRQRRALLSSLPTCSRLSQVTTWTCVRVRSRWKGQSARPLGAAGPQQPRGPRAAKRAPTHPRPTHPLGGALPEGETMESAAVQ